MIRVASSVVDVCPGALEGGGTGWRGGADGERVLNNLDHMEQRMFAQLGYRKKKCGMRMNEGLWVLFIGKGPLEAKVSLQSDIGHMDPLEGRGCRYWQKRGDVTITWTQKMLLAGGYAAWETCVGESHVGACVQRRVQNRQEGNALFGFQDLCLRQELLEYMGVHDNDASESSQPSWGKMKYTAYVRRIVADFSHAPPNEYSPSPNDKKQWSLVWFDFYKFPLCTSMTSRRLFKLLQSFRICLR
ncbi:hypothetical protein Tco_1070715 [Tanacetum coccineum]|uniref:Uncharacterized protein n=1 Tax=Tanacetum coccineum TaxID=301880 RepID=A0ABQ5HM73_9ASTR